MMHQKVIVKRFYQHQNNLETDRVIFKQHIQIFSLTSILHMSPLDDAAHSMCSTYKKKNFRASSYKSYQ